MKNIYRWNILLVVTMLLIVSTIIAFLTLRFLQNLFVFTHAVNDYYTTFYLARGGIEFSDYALSRTRVWFQFSWSLFDIISWSQSVCQKKDCDVVVNIFSQSDLLGDKYPWLYRCPRNSFFLAPWEWLLLPLFVEWSTNFLTQPSFNQLIFDPLLLTVPWWSGEYLSGGEFALALITDRPVRDEQEASLSLLYNQSDMTNKKFLSDFFSSDTIKNFITSWSYLVFKNIDKTVMLQWCFWFNQMLASSFVRIVSQGRFGRYQLVLNASKNVSLPLFLIDTIVER